MGCISDKVWGDTAQIGRFNTWELVTLSYLNFHYICENSSLHHIALQGYILVYDANTMVCTA